MTQPKVHAADVIDENSESIFGVRIEKVEH